MLRFQTQCSQSSKAFLSPGQHQQQEQNRKDIDLQVREEEQKQKELKEQRRKNRELKAIKEEEDKQKELEQAPDVLFPYDVFIIIYCCREFGLIYDPTFGQCFLFDMFVQPACNYFAHFTHDRWSF